MKTSKDGWRLALEVLRTTARPEARFFSLGCLQNALGGHAGASVLVEAEHDRRMIREAIMEWLKTGSGAELKIQETFIRTKVECLSSSLQYVGQLSKIFCVRFSLGAISRVAAMKLLFPLRYRQYYGRNPLECGWTDFIKLAS